MPTDLNVLVRADASTRTVVIEPTGRLTIENVPKLIKVLMRASTLAGGTRIHIDLSQLTAIEPGARASLAECLRRHSDLLPITVNSSGLAADAVELLESHRTPEPAS